jgi:hypothetical protein
MEASYKGLATTYTPSAEPGGDAGLQIGEKEEQLERLESLPHQLTEDSYDAVVAAAFGGITIELPSTDAGESQFIRLHPVMVLAMSVALFYVQFSCLSCLVLDMELGNIYKSDAHANALKGGLHFHAIGSHNPDHQMKFIIRTIMVIVLQLIGLKELLGALRPIFLMINPYTWQLLVRPPTEKWGALFRWQFCLPLCLAAKFMQLFIGYYVLIVSMSTIVTADSVKNVIFNGLVVTFLADLDEYAWVAMTAIFHMDKARFEHFRFRVKEDPEYNPNPNHRRAEETAHLDKPEEMKFEMMEWDEHLKLSGYCDMRRDAKNHGWKFYMWHGKGGKSGVTENWFVFTVLLYIYTRQLFMYIQMIHTGILPVARDVCRFYRGLKQPAKHWLGAIELTLADLFTFVSYRQTVEFSAERANITDDCFHGHYSEGPFDKALEYAALSPKFVVGAVFTLFMLLVVPQIILPTLPKIVGLLGNNARPAE